MNVPAPRVPLVAVAVVFAVAACTASPVASPSGRESPAPERTPALSASASPAASASVSASPAPSAAALPDLTLERLDLPRLVENSAVVDVVAGGPGFVALAHDGLQGTTLLTSQDGRAWTLLPQPQWQTMALVDLVESGGLLVAVGRDTADIENELAVVWLSDDGVEWRRAEGGPDLQGAQLIDVIATDDGFVAAGGFPSRDAGGMWSSADGEIWTLTTTPEPFSRAFTWAVTEGGPGFVAVGWLRNDDPAVGFEPAFWTSGSGLTWTLAPTPDGAPGSQVRDVVSSDAGLVAVGDLVQGGRAFAWASADGTSWELVEGHETFDGAVATGVTAFDGGVIAVGGRNVDDGGVWLTADGHRWAVVEDPELADAYLVDALPVADGVIVVGALQRRIAGTESYESAPMIWYGTAD